MEDSPFVFVNCFKFLGLPTNTEKKLLDEQKGYHRVSWAPRVQAWIQSFTGDMASKEPEEIWIQEVDSQNLFQNL